MRVLQPETTQDAVRDIAEAEAAFGVIPPEVLAAARRLRWLQAPQAAPPAGFYYPELVAHPVVVTNFREIFNDHIGAHIMAFVLAFARDFHTYLPQQMRRAVPGQTARHRRRAPAGGDGADRRRGRDRQRGGAPVQGVRHAGDRCRCPAQRHAGGRGRAARARSARRAAAAGGFRHHDHPAYAGDGRADGPGAACAA